MPVRVHKLIESFLSDITLVIPEQADNCISLREGLEKDTNNVIRRIVQHLGEHDEAIVARDDSFLSHSSAEIIPGIAIGPYWAELSNVSKDTVWKYLNLMLLAGAKHIRALDRVHKTKSEVSNDAASEIAKRLRDPEVRTHVLDTIRKTMEAMPDETDENVNPMDRLKAVEELVSGLKDTQIGKFVEEITSDLSGELSPGSLGIPPDVKLESLDTKELIGYFTKPEVMSRVMGMFSKISDTINKRMTTGELDTDLLVKEGQNILSKSKNLMKNISPQVAQMFSAFTGNGGNGGNGGKVNARKMARALSKMSSEDVAAAVAGGGKGKHRSSNVRDRLRKKLAKRQKEANSETRSATQKKEKPDDRHEEMST